MIIGDYKFITSNNKFVIGAYLNAKYINMFFKKSLNKDDNNKDLKNSLVLKNKIELNKISDNNNIYKKQFEQEKKNQIKENKKKENIKEEAYEDDKGKQNEDKKKDEEKIEEEEEEEDDDEEEEDEENEDENEQLSLNQNLDPKRIIINSQYFVQSLGYGSIIIWIISKNEKIRTNEDSPYNIALEFNPFYKNIFMSISLDDIRIWEICEQKKVVFKKIIIYKKESPNKLIFGKFSPFNENIVFTVYQKIIVQVWNLKQKINDFERKIKKFNDDIKDIAVSPNENIIGLISSKKVFICNLKKKKRNNIMKIKGIILFFQFIGPKKFIIIYDNKIQILTTKKELINNFEYSFDNDFKHYFYINNHFLYIFSNYITIINIINKQNEKKKSLDIVDKIKFLEPDKISFIDNNIKNKMIIIIKNNFIYFYQLNIEKLYHNQAINDLEKNEIYFWKEKLIRIYGKFRLCFSNADIEKNEIYLNKYLKLKSISKQVKTNYKISLKQKKLNVENELKVFKTKKTVKEQFFYIINLVIQDNTNKKLIKLYLTFLKNNKEKLKNIMHEKYEDELQFYKVLFEKEELVKDLGEDKKISEKEDFLDLINSLANIKEKKSFTQFKNSIDYSKLGKFNQDIDFNKNKELYWHRNKNLILYAITKIDFDNFELMNYCIDKVIEMKLLEKDYIINNRQKLTFLIINIVLPQEKNVCDYNLNLLNSKLYSKNEFIEILKKNGFKINSENKYYLEGFNTTIDPNKDTNICIENFILKEKKLLDDLSNDEISIFDKYIDNFYPKINFNKIRIYLLKFLRSNLFREAYYILYPDTLVFPFENKEDTENFIENKIFFIPTINKKAKGVTDKFTLEEYIFIKKKKISDLPSKISNIEKDLILEELYTGSLIKTLFHENNHNMYNIFYYHSNFSIPLKTPRKYQTGKLGESGREFEIILFGDKVKSLNIKQIMYILNEENFEKGVLEFREGFNSLNKDLEIKGEFSYFNEIKKFLCNPYINNTTISSENFDDICSIEADDDNDVLGFLNDNY